MGKDQRATRGSGWSGTRRAGLALALFATALSIAGCAQNELGIYSGYNPDSIVVRNSLRRTFEIVKSENYWLQREVQPEEQFPGPTPQDLKPTTADYVLGPGDLIDITVFELMAPGQPYISRQRISQSGQITFPYISTVKSAGLTTRGLEEKIADMLAPDYIIDAQVSVFVVEYRNLNVSVLNGFYRPGIYPMSKQDMTLLELVAMAGGILQLTEDYGYVIRTYTPEEADILMLESSVAPGEGEAKGALGAATGPAGGAAGAPKSGEKDKAAPEAFPKAGEKQPANGAAKNGEEPPVEGALKNGAKAGPGAAPALAAKAVPAMPAPGADKQVRELLERMAEGEMPPVSKIEAAEAGAAAASAAKSGAPGNGASPAASAAGSEAVSATGSAAASPTGSAAGKTALDAAKTGAGDAAAQALAKDEAELSQWIWSDGKFVEIKPKTLPAATKTAAVAEAPRPAEAVKSTEPAAVAEATKPAEATRPAESVTATAVATVAAKEGKTPEVEAARLQVEQKLRRQGVVQGGGMLKRIIRFDVKALQSGDPTQNLVLRDSDIVTIPSPAIGDFYMGGEIARPGVYSLTGRKMTLLQGVMSAGGLTAVAVPWRTEIIRRVSETEQEIIYMDLGKISRGEAPDIYIQPEDQIRIGTDQGAIFNAVFRNAFRATYGLGSVYDMNFADFYPWAKRALPIIGVGAL